MIDGSHNRAANRLLVPLRDVYCNCSRPARRKRILRSSCRHYSIRAVAVSPGISAWAMASLRDTALNEPPVKLSSVLCSVNTDCGQELLPATKRCPVRRRYDMSWGRSRQLCPPSCVRYRRCAGLITVTRARGHGKTACIEALPICKKTSSKPQG